MLPTVTARSSGLSPMALLQDLSRNIDRVLGGGSDFAPRWGDGAHPSAEMFETDEAVHLRIDAPGRDPDDFDIELENRVLTVSVRRRAEMEPDRGEGTRTWIREWSLGEWTRSFVLPFGADQEGIQAVYERGVLSIAVPKVPEARPRRIPVARDGMRGRLVSGGKKAS